MESLAGAAAIVSSSSPITRFSPIRSPNRRPSILPLASKNRRNESEFEESQGANLVPLINKCTSLTPLSRDAAMGLVLSAATSRGWTTGSGMEGPSVPAPSDSADTPHPVSTFPWSLFTKSPRRRMRVAFTCSVCGQRTTRAINPHAYTDGTVFVQCCGCNVFHKLVDNLNLFHDMKCYVNPSFRYRDADREIGFKFLDMDGDDGADGFPLV
ncbi:hypothetical protein H6P81_018694 [Aristolochia fimbriata]|uniref:DNL-type domain-containing protein n=1 Tax=Aristolochia fimbriata TaxID=158543 RepID=A0AAV7E3Y7_ARIFI|nr:hypothetical protein H6P81_018694 [Aristolochia fimbriata]